MPHGIRLAGEAAPRLHLIGGEGERLALVARERADLGDELGVGDVAGCDGHLELAHERHGVGAGEQPVVLAREGRHRLAAGGRAVHRLAAGGCAVLGRDGGAVELGDLHEVGAGPEPVLERLESRAPSNSAIFMR